MRVLFCSRLDLLDVIGGDTVQVIETKRALEHLGLHIDVCTIAEPDVSSYDVVHLFNTQFPDVGLPQIRHVKKAGKPIALSTIYWERDPTFASHDVLRYDAFGKLVNRIGPFHPASIGRALHMLENFRMDTSKKIRTMLEIADVLLPNSVAELEILVSTFNYPMARSKATVVVNAVKPMSENPSLSEESKAKLLALPERFVMEAARIEPVKGQLQLLRATKLWCPEVPIVFVGGARKSPYVDAVREEMGRRSNVFHLDVIPHDELPPFYTRAGLHVLPSLRESPGLSTLEAAVYGCNCVVGIHAPVQEYFGTDAWVCDPGDVDSIGRAVKAAWAAPLNPALGRRVREEFTWTRAAEQTLGAYDQLLRRSFG